MLDVVCSAPAADRLDQSQPLGSGVRLVPMAPSGDLAHDDAVPEVVWVSADAWDPPELTRHLFGLALHQPGVRWLASSGAGVEHPVFRRLLDAGVRVTNAHVNWVAIAEYVVRAGLDHLQGAGEWRAAAAERAWRTHEFREVLGSTWVVVGLGHIGTGVAERVRAFGAEVIGVRRRPTGDEPVDRVVTPDRLAEVLPRADVVVLAASANAGNDGLVDAAFLSAMRPGSLLVNVARGALVDEAALLAALDRGVPAAAVLDVVRTEPLPANDPLWSHPRVSITPHGSALGDGRFARDAELFAGNLARYREGRPLRHEVTLAHLAAEGA